jgi:surface polysaccharide O-acyltransferase-like enzyme
VLLLVMIVGAVLGACLILAFLGLGAPVVPYGLAIVLVCLAYRCPVGPNGFVAAVAPLAFGIYLVHPLALYGVKHFLAANGHYAVLVALTACLCGLITFGLMKTPLRRFV